MDNFPEIQIEENDFKKKQNSWKTKPNKKPSP